MLDSSTKEQKFPKQVAINKFSVTAGLPQEMSEEIKGFCFYDTITAGYRAKHMAKIADVKSHFDNAIVSRKNSGDSYIDPDTDEHWSICLENNEDVGNGKEEIQYQAINCRICGNYKMCDTFYPTTEHIVDGNPDFDIGDDIWHNTIPFYMKCCCINEYNGR